MYCEDFDNLFYGTDTQLSKGCVKCIGNYIDVGGFCVANLTQ